VVLGVGVGLVAEGGTGAATSAVVHAASSRAAPVSAIAARRAVPVWAIAAL
jgi:hypothetical protein